MRNRSRIQDDWEEYKVARRHAQLAYEEAERAFTKRSKSLLMNTPNSRNLEYTNCGLWNKP